MYEDMYNEYKTYQKPKIDRKIEHIFQSEDWLLIIYSSLYEIENGICSNTLESYAWCCIKWRCQLDSLM